MIMFDKLKNYSFKNNLSMFINDWLYSYKLFYDKHNNLL